MKIKLQNEGGKNEEMKKMQEKQQNIRNKGHKKLHSRKKENYFLK